MTADKEPTDLPLLVRRAQAGDNGAFDLLAGRFRAYAVAFALARVNDAGLAQDAVQEAFLEAWVCLPRLRHPTAFPAFLRRILLKRCDRLTRGMQAANVSLETLTERPGEGAEPAEVAEARRQRGVLAGALEALSPTDRTALLMHYADGASQEEVAAFLGLTVSAVKSRLHRARQRLREEISQMEETVRELLGQYRTQVHQWATANGPQADAHLLERARQKFDRQMKDRGEETPPDLSTARLGVSLFTQLSDHAAVVALLGRYLDRPLPPEEGLWARWHRTRSLAHCQRYAEAVEAHREMRAYFAGLASPPRLSRRPPFSTEWTPCMTEAEVPLWVLMPMNGKSLVPLAYSALGSRDEWAAAAEEALARTPATEESRRLRHDIRQTLRMFAAQTKRGTVDLLGRFQRETLAEGDEHDALHWEIERERARLNQAQRTGDQAEMRDTGSRLVALVADLPPRDHRRWIAASGLIFAGLFDLALPVVRPYVENGKTDWVWLAEYAVCLWKVTGETATPAALLREAQAMRQRRGGQPDLDGLPVWKRNGLDAVPEFVAAIH